MFASTEISVTRHSVFARRSALATLQRAKICEFAYADFRRRASGLGIPVQHLQPHYSQECVYRHTCRTGMYQWSYFQRAKIPARTLVCAYGRPIAGEYITGFTVSPVERNQLASRARIHIFTV